MKEFDTILPKILVLFAVLFDPYFQLGSSSSFSNQMPPSSRIFFFPFVFMSIFLITALFAAVWVYYDADKRGEIGIVWALIVFFAPILGLIIYLIVRAEGSTLFQKQTIPDHANLGGYCNECGQPITKGSSYCMNCGNELQETINS